MKKELNKWQRTFSLSPDFLTVAMGWKVLNFGVFKLTSFPEEGMKITRKNHKGFIVRISFWFPIDKIEVL